MYLTLTDIQAILETLKQEACEVAVSIKHVGGSAVQEQCHDGQKDRNGIGMHQSCCKRRNICRCEISEEDLLSYIHALEEDNAKLETELTSRKNDAENVGNTFLKRKDIAKRLTLKIRSRCNGGLRSRICAMMSDMPISCAESK